MTIKKSELKARAKEKMKGLENIIIPSFTPDLSELDEEGIRWDVRQSIKHGFFSTLCNVDIGLTMEEAKSFVEIVVDEAKDKILVSVNVARLNSFAQIKEILQHGDKVGCNAALMLYPPNFFPKSEEEIFQATKELCDATNLSIMFYATHRYNYEKFHPAGLSPELLSRIADIENVVAFKISSNDFGYVTEVCDLCGDRILASHPYAGFAPCMIRAYGQQWMGAATFEIYQSPEKPYLVESFDLMIKGEFDKGMAIFKKLKPIMTLFEIQMMPSILLGSYHWALLKYYQWLVGGNGGLVRNPVLRMNQSQMEMAKNALRAIGITPREPDEEFFVGRVNYAK